MHELAKGKKNHEHCRFCEWLENWEQWKKQEEGRARVICENRGWVALLDKFPRVEGDTLVVSRKPYDDIADTFELSIEETYDFFEIVRRVTSCLKEGLGAQKVYIFSMCEHWEEKDIDYKDKKTSEHLHFHLIPRYSWMKEEVFKPTLIKKEKKEFIPEEVFMIEGKEASNQQLLKVRKKICNV